MVIFFLCQECKVGKLDWLCPCMDTACFGLRCVCGLVSTELTSMKRVDGEHSIVWSACLSASSLLRSNSGFLSMTFLTSLGNLLSSWLCARILTTLSQVDRKKLKDLEFKFLHGFTLSKQRLDLTACSIKTGAFCNQFPFTLPAAKAFKKKLFSQQAFKLSLTL